MNIYNVVEKATGTIKYTYSHTEPIIWDGYPAELFDTILVGQVQSIVDPLKWRIHIGPFFDRFKQYKIPILASSDPVVRAIVTDTSIRKYIDLYNRRADVAAAIDALISKGFPLNKVEILDTPVAPEDLFLG